MLSGKEEWDALAGTDHQGPVIYYRREQPRLAEIEVWTVGENIGIGLIERGGSVTSFDNNGAEPAVVDGDFFGEVLYWPAVGMFDIKKVLPSQPVDFERQLLINLGGAFFLDNIRVLQLAPKGSSARPFPQYRLQISDGSTNAGGALAWTTVGAVKGLDIGRSGSSQRYNNFEFPLSKVKHFSFTYRMFANNEFAGWRGSFALSEIQFFGEGYMPESQISSQFEGEAPFIELAEVPQNLASIEWDADSPPGTDLILQTRTGNTVKSITHYYKKTGEEYPGTEEEAAEAHASDKEFFGANSVGPVITETIPGSDWSGWSQPYFSSGEKITSPSPRKYVAIRANLLTTDPLKAPLLRAVTLNFVTPVANQIVGEILPSRLEKLGIKQQMSYFIRPTFESINDGFDEIRIQAPDGVDMTLLKVTLHEADAASEVYTANSEESTVISDQSDTLWIRLPKPIKNVDKPTLIEIQFEAMFFNYNTFFIGSLRNSAIENSWQRVDDGNANGFPDSETTVVLAIERGGVLGDVEINDYVTPNGDGVNDILEVNYSVMRVGSLTPVHINVYNLTGALVNKLHSGPIEAGRHTTVWAGMDKFGTTVPPGVYLLKINVDTDSKTTKDNSALKLINVPPQARSEFGRR